MCVSVDVFMLFIALLFSVFQFESNKLWVTVSPNQNGVISVFDLSRDLGVSAYLSTH